MYINSIPSLVCMSISRLSIECILIHIHTLCSTLHNTPYTVHSTIHSAESITCLVVGRASCMWCLLHVVPLA